MSVYFNKTKTILEGVRDFEGHFKIPSTVVRIVEGAFDGSCDITSIEIPESVRYLESQCLGCLHVTSLELPPSITEIPSLCFVSCHRLKSLTIPESITRIGGMAFFECFELEDVYVPASATEIEHDAFALAPKLKVTVSPGNPRFYSKDGWIYSRDGSITFLKTSEELDAWRRARLEEERQRMEAEKQNK